MGKKAQDREMLRFSSGNIDQSAVAVGSGAQASNDAGGGRDLAEVRAKLAGLTELLQEQELRIKHKEEIQQDVLAVRSELDRKKPNLRLVRSALKGIVASLGPAQALAALAAQVLAMVRGFG